MKLDTHFAARHHLTGLTLIVNGEAHDGAPQTRAMGVGIMRDLADSRCVYPPWKRGTMSTFVSQMHQHVAVVTGGNTGIGKAIAIAFAQAGVSVAVAARRAAEGLDTVEQIKMMAVKPVLFPQMCLRRLPSYL